MAPLMAALQALGREPVRPPMPEIPQIPDRSSGKSSGPTEAVAADYLIGSVLPAWGALRLLLRMLSCIRPLPSGFRAFGFRASGLQG